MSDPTHQLGQWLWPERLRAVDPASADAAARYRELLAAAAKDLRARFLAEESIEALVRARALLIDVLFPMASGCQRPSSFGWS